MPGGQQLPEVALATMEGLSHLFKCSPVVLIPFILILCGSIFKWGNVFDISGINYAFSEKAPCPAVVPEGYICI